MDCGPALKDLPLDFCQGIRILPEQDIVIGLPDHVLHCQARQGIDNLGVPEVFVLH